MYFYSLVPKKKISNQIEDFQIIFNNQIKLDCRVCLQTQQKYLPLKSELV